MRKLNICIDIDGTVTEPYYWLPRANEYFNTNIQPKDVTSYEIHKILGVEQKDYIEFYNIFGVLLHKEAEIRIGVKEVINKLYKNNEIHFVTAREEKMRHVSLEWLARHQIPMDSISLLGSPNKISKAEELESDIFIEDSYDNAMQLSKAGFDVLLLDCNYNKGTLPSNITRVKNWFEINEILENYSKRSSKLKLAL